MKKIVKIMFIAKKARNLVAKNDGLRRANEARLARQQAQQLEQSVAQNPKKKNNKPENQE